MLTHKYQSGYSQFLGLSDKYGAIFLTGAVIMAGLSVIRPQFFQILISSTIKKILRGIQKVLRPKGQAGKEGLLVVDQWVPDAAWLRQAQIVGSTGTGKSVFEEYLIYQRIAMGYGVLIIDPKGDREHYLRVGDFCRSVGREKDLHYLSATHPEESVRWNPCSLGNASELQSKWFNSATYNEPFYAKACELGLLEAFNALLDDKPYHFTMQDLVEQLKKQAGDGKQQNMQGLFMDLQVFAKSEWGHVLCVPQGAAGSNRQVVSLLDITSRNQILFVDLPTEAKAVQGSRVGRLLLQEMMLISGLRKLHPELKSSRPFAVFVDEFDAFATQNFATFLNKGRSSDFMIHIAHQTLSDLERVSPTFKGQVMGNCDVRIIFRQDDPKDAEEWAKHIGTKQVIKKTFRSSSGLETGESSNREAEQFLIHPNTIKGLRVGECVLSVKTDGILEQLRIPFPLRLPKRKGVIEREMPDAGLRGPGNSGPKERKSFEEMNSGTTEQGTILEAGRQAGREQKFQRENREQKKKKNSIDEESSR